VLLAFEAEPLAETVALGSRALAALEAASEQTGEPDSLDAPVFVAEAVLREVGSLAEQAGDVETGGVLIGHLHRDAGGSEVFAEVVAQIPARHAEADSTSFAFTPETWAAADAALALRGARERILGWWHSHPNFCRACPDERRRSCTFARPFFSREDEHLHRTCFPQAWQLALLVSDLPDVGWTPALFGWRAGRIVERGFRRPHHSEKEGG
jgi:proteasome lid subunit RPN8/RPN11